MSCKRKVIHLPLPIVPDQTATKRGSRIKIQPGAQQYAIDVTCTATAIPEPPVAKTGRIAKLRVETQFLRLNKPARLGDRIDGWRVCCLGGWDKSRIFYVVMVVRVVRGGNLKYK